MILAWFHYMQDVFVLHPYNPVFKTMCCFLCFISDCKFIEKINTVVFLDIMSK